MYRLFCFLTPFLVLANLSNAQSVVAVPISTAFNSPIGIDYHEPTNSLITSVNFSGGIPHNLERVELDGTRVPFSSLSGLTNELKIATVRSLGNIGGFVVGDVFTPRCQNSCP
ncbi:MAG: hypothetical protein V3W41_16195 [Planctomycetota bacterium]